jgi:hypothetical protein
MFKPSRITPARTLLVLGLALAIGFTMVGEVAAQLLINEVMACNTRVIYDEDGDYEDWLEIYNPGPDPVNLLGYGLSDDPDQPFKWVFPNRLLNGDDHRLVWVSGKNRTSFLHTTFKLDSQGDSLLLTAPGGELLDALWTGPMSADQSVGRAPDGAPNWLYLTEETHAEANPDIGYTGFAASLGSDQAPGLRSTPFAVTLSSPSPGAQIRYTLDGSEPDSLDTLATAPIPVSMNTVLRARGFETDLLPGPILSLSWFFGEERELPLISLITDPLHLWDEDFGIYVLGEGYNPDYPYYGANFWRSWERPAHLEFYESDGSLALAQDIGIRIHGGYTRALAQKSLRLIARDGYGAGRMHHQVFPDLDIGEFKYLVLRNGGNDWSHAHCRDGLMQTIATASGISRQAYRPAVLFINGEYWGIHNLRERMDPEYIESHHDFEEDEIDLIKEFDFVMAGDELHYEAMMEFIEGADLANPVDFAMLQSMMDTENFLAYCALEVLFANYDWPGGNIKFWRPRAPGGIWQWLLYDLDYGWGLHHDADLNALSRALDPVGAGWPNPPHSTLLLRSLMTNADFKRDFINHSCELLSRRFEPLALHAAVDSVTAVIADEMALHMPRWGFTLPDWDQAVLDLHDWADARPGAARLHLQSEFGLGDTLRLELAIDPPGSGCIALSALDVCESWSGLYHAGNPVMLRAEAHAGYRFVGWEGLPLPPVGEVAVDLVGPTQLSALFAPLAADAASAVINEINYHSPDGHDTGDWVEFHNPGSEDLDLSGWQFKDEEDTHVFDFPPGTILSAEGYLLLCGNRTAFLSYFPAANPLPDELSFGLSGGGEILRLYDDQGRLYDAVQYDDTAPWPPEADGQGPSLELLHPLRDNALAENWAASEAPHLFGSPGQRNSAFDDTASDEGPLALAPILTQPHPNPFNPATRIRFYLPESGEAALSVFSANGRRVAELRSGVQRDGWHEEIWRPEALASGVYLLELRTREHRSTRKLLLLK